MFLTRAHKHKKSRVADEVPDCRNEGKLEYGRLCVCCDSLGAQ